MKGSYILLIEFKKYQEIQVGKIGKIFFKKGYYAYIGSALNGLENRIKRHLRSEKKMHWHIDYLLQHSEVKDVFYKESLEKIECGIAQKFEKTSSIKGFGCSDCACESHLFYADKDIIYGITQSVGMNKYVFDEKI